MTGCVRLGERETGLERGGTNGLLIGPEEISKGSIDSRENQHLRFSRISFQEHDRNHTPGVSLVHVVPTSRAEVHDRSETHVVAVDERPQPFALLS
jgi:hypothetical protein